MKFPTYEQMAKNVAEKALDEILYDGKSIREWIKIIGEQEPKQGYWIYDDDCHEHGHCSECGTKEDLVDGKIRYFCRVCGAKMDCEVNE